MVERGYVKSTAVHCSHFNYAYGKAKNAVCRRYLRSFGILSSTEWQFLTDVSG